MIEQIKGDVFDARVRQSAKPVVVDFFGKQCQPCKKLLPILEEVATELGDKVTFVKVDVEDAEDVASELGVFSVPTVLVFKDGHPVDKVVGLVSKASLSSRLAEVAD
jgi:thioredoxin 1